MRRQASRTGADSAERILASMDDPSSQSSTQARTSMVARQLVRRGIEDPRVLEVMARLPREAFVPGTPESVAYDDRALPIDEGQTISQPYIVARMTELLAVEMLYAGTLPGLVGKNVSVRYTLLRIAAHTFFHIGDIASVRSRRLGQSVGDYPGPLLACM